MATYRSRHICHIDGRTAVTIILVVDDEPMLCDLFRGWLYNQLGADVECSLTATIGRTDDGCMRYDLAVIDAVLPDASGAALAELAANQNTPALLISGHPEVIVKLGQFGFPTLQKPFVSVAPFTATFLSRAPDPVRR